MLPDKLTPAYNEEALLAAVAPVKIKRLSCRKATEKYGSMKSTLKIEFTDDLLLYNQNITFCTLLENIVFQI